MAAASAQADSGTDGNAHEWKGHAEEKDTSAPEQTHEAHSDQGALSCLVVCFDGMGHSCPREQDREGPKAQIVHTSHMFSHFQRVMNFMGMAYAPFIAAASRTRRKPAITPVCIGVPSKD